MTTFLTPQKADEQDDGDGEQEPSDAGSKVQDHFIWPTDAQHS